MMQLMAAPGTTQYDLRFSVMNIPVRVHPLFWLVALLLGMGVRELSLIVIWIACLFVSILIHELGHALAARSYGWPPDIILYWLGGLARYSPGHGYTKYRSIWISFAGPLAGFGLFGIVYCAELWLRAGIAQDQQWATTLMSSNAATGISFAFAQMKWINLGWGLINLLPVFPLDGGRICYELLNAGKSYSGRLRAHQIGMIAAGLMALHLFFNMNSLWGGLMFGSFAYDNYRIHNQLRSGYQ